MLAAATRVPLAFFERDRRIETSYRMGLLLKLAASFVTVGIFFFISQTFGAAAASHIDQPGGYFAFVLVGIAVNEFLATSINGLGASVREGQTTGTLEILLLSPSRLPTILLSSTLWLHAEATLTALLYIAIGAMLGVDLSRVDLIGTLVALALTIVAFTGLGLLAAAVVIAVKRGNPVGWAIRGASIVLGGVFYPVAVLPEPLRIAGMALPITHALEVLRATVLDGRGLLAAGPSLLVLAILAVVYLAIGLGACAAVVRWARHDGSLGQY